MNRWPGKPDIRNGHFGEEKNLTPLPKIEYRTVQLRSLIIMPIELYWLSKYCLGINSKSQKVDRVYAWRQHLKLNISDTECYDFKSESKVVSVEAKKEHGGVYL